MLLAGAPWLSAIGKLLLAGAPRQSCWPASLDAGALLSRTVLAEKPQGCIGKMLLAVKPHSSIGKQLPLRRSLYNSIGKQQPAVRAQSSIGKH